MNRQTRIAIIVALITPFSMGCFCCCGGCGVDQQKENLTEADKLYAAGNHGAAAAKYKSVYTSFWTSSSDKEKILPRIVEYETKAGNIEEAKTWMKRGLEDQLKVEYKDPAAKELFAAAKKEHDAAKAEAARKAEEERKERARRQAIEDAKPKPTRANYNKIQPGMTIEEVQAILGPGRESASAPGVLVATWKSDDFLLPTIISITFENGRVAAKAIAP
jgi:hypothetical protein